MVDSALKIILTKRIDFLAKNVILVLGSKVRGGVGGGGGGGGFFGPPCIFRLKLLMSRVIYYTNSGSPLPYSY